ncbi:MAG TPA: PepSY-associated TM helix domain-containing protein [Candidatus Acidoferrales bacterium]|nr:PepSY-associated TM helix domain-containing protein [Candidatus Acidoferrales bacterium]
MRTIFAVHQFAGFVFGAYLIVVCGTGAAILMLENQIAGYRDYPMLPVPIRAHQATLARMVQTVQRANPRTPVYHILESCARGCTYDLSMHAERGRLDALVDPFTGAIVKTVQWDRTPIGVLYRLHGSLMAGDIGETVNAIAGLSAVLLGATGLALWPGWRSPRRGFTIAWRGTPFRINYDLHKLAGITAVLFLFMWALTAAGQVFWPEPPEPIPESREAGRALGLDRLAEIGNAALPGELTFVYTAAGGTVVVRKRVPGDPDPYGYSYVAVDARTGTIRRVYDIRKFPLPWRIRAALYAVHIGSPGGTVLRSIYAVAGLAPALLFTTALLMWLNQVRPPVAPSPKN